MIKVSVSGLFHSFCLSLNVKGQETSKGAEMKTELPIRSNLIFSTARTFVPFRYVRLILHKILHRTRKSEQEK